MKEETVRFTGNISLAQVSFQRAGGGNDLSIRLNTNDSITIKMQFSVAGETIQYFTFADGTYDWASLSQHYVNRQQTTGNDVIYGTIQNNTIMGGLGNDTIDMAFGGSQSLIYTRGDGQDTVIAWDNMWTATPDRLVIRDILSTEATFSRAQSNLAANELLITLPNSGSITIRNQLIGGNDPIETIFFERDNVTFTAHELHARIAPAQPTAGNDSIIGTAQYDVLYGGAGNDTLYGGADNSFFGLSDSLYGGAGNDILVITEGSDVLDGGDGEDVVDMRQTRSPWSITLDEDEIQYSESTTIFKTTAVNIEHVIASPQNDTIRGSNGNNHYRGHDGHDSINGGYGNDTIDGEAGRDTIDGGYGNDIIRFSARTHSTMSAADYIRQFRIGDDIIDLSGLGFNRITYELPKNSAEIQIYFDSRPSMNNTFFAAGRASSDFSFYLEGELASQLSMSDVIFDAASVTNTTLQADNVQVTGTQNRIIHGLHGDDTIISSSGNDTLIGGRGDDSIQGAAGNDNINGGEDRDTIIGGLGDDTLTGGLGDDTFLFTSATHSTRLASDRITDFTSGDKIDVTALGYAS
ncbi:MAG: hypothetical protein EAY76_07520, partial [Alphaproteobacteria bacterium]